MISYSRYTGMLAVILIGLVIFSNAVFGNSRFEQEIHNACVEDVNYFVLIILRAKASEKYKLELLVQEVDKEFKDSPPYVRDALKTFIKAIWNQENEQYHVDKMFNACVRYMKENIPKEYI